MRAGEPLVHRITIFNATDRRTLRARTAPARARRPSRPPRSFKRLNETLEERVTAGGRRAPEGRGGTAPGPEDGGHRPAHRRRRPRLQQPAHHHRRQHRDAAAPPAAEAARMRSERPTTPCEATQRAATLTQRLLAFCPPAAARSEAHRRQQAGVRACRTCCGARWARRSCWRPFSAAVCGARRPIRTSWRMRSSTWRSTPATPCRMAASSRSRPPMPIWTRPMWRHSRSRSRPVSTSRRRHRHRDRHGQGDDGAGVRAVLHHQGGRQGNGPGPEPGVRLRPAVRTAMSGSTASWAKARRSRSISLGIFPPGMMIADTEEMASRSRAWRRGDDPCCRGRGEASRLRGRGARGTRISRD